MVPPWKQRVKEWICRHFGHKKDFDGAVYWCKRCRWLV